MVGSPIVGTLNKEGMYLNRDPFVKGVTATLLDTWILEALQLYRVAKHPEDKEALRTHIMDCQIAMSMIGEGRTLPTSSSSPAPSSSSSSSSSPTSPATKAKKNKQD